MDVRAWIKIKDFHLLSRARVKRKNERKLLRQGLQRRQDASEGFSVVNVRRPMQRHDAVASESGFKRASRHNRLFSRLQSCLLVKQVVDHDMTDVTNPFR